MVDVITMPTTPRPLDATMSPVTFSTDMTGPLGGPTQRILRVGDRFKVDLSYGPLIYDDARKFLARLVRATASPVAVEFPQRGLRPVYPGQLEVSGAISSPGMLPVSGGTPDFLLKEGQFFSLTSSGRRWVHQIQNDTFLDDSGAAQLPINPLLRVSPAVGDTLEFINPVLEGFADMNWSWTIALARRVGLRFSITEDR